MREPRYLQQDQRRQCIKIQRLTDNIRLVCERGKQLRKKDHNCTAGTDSCPSGKLYRNRGAGRLCKNGALTLC